MGIGICPVGGRFWRREREQAAGKLLSWCSVCVPGHGGSNQGVLGLGEQTEVQKTNTNVPQPILM